MNEKQQKISDAARNVRHCFDYLRQILQCNADTTVEMVKDEEGLDERKDGGRWTGFGIEHKCQDLDGMKRWIGRLV